MFKEWLKYFGIIVGALAAVATVILSSAILAAYVHPLVGIVFLIVTVAASAAAIMVVIDNVI